MSTGRRSDSHWASLPESGSTAWLWIMYLSYVWIGRPLFRLLLWPGSWYFITVRPVARRASIEYQRRVGVLAADSGAWQAWRAAGRARAPLRRHAARQGAGVDWWPRARRHTARSRSSLRRAVDENRGGVLVVAHFGNLEVLRRMGEHAKQLRLHILVHTRHAERFNRVLTRMNPQSAERLLQVTEVDTATIAHLAARVELGDFVVIAADRVPVTSERVLYVPFLGADAAFPIGPWVLAAALGCPVYWLACYQRPGDHGRYTLVCELMRERIMLPRKTRDAALREVIADYVRYLERACHEAPLAWFNFFPFWRTSK